MGFSGGTSRSLSEAEKQAAAKPSKKTVFANAMLCHVWANQSQTSGRNASDTLYFKGDEIYSYGSHFLAAKIYTKKDGTKFALVNSHNYSMATSGHLSDIRSSLDSLMPWYRVPRVGDLKAKENIEYYSKDIINYLADTFNSRTSEYSADTDNLLETIKEANEFFALVGEKLIVITDAQKADLVALKKEKIAIKKARELFNSTPEMVAKKEERKAKELSNLNDYVENLKANLLGDFRNFKSNNVDLKDGDKKKIKQVKGYYSYQDYSFRYQFLRVSNTKTDSPAIETSNGATVPLDHAIRLLKLILKDKAKEGERVGLFSLESISDDPKGDKTIKIGCHRILLSEAVNVLKPYMNNNETNLKLV